MIYEVDDLQKYLQGLEEGMQEEFYMLAQVFKNQVFELYVDHDSIYIPYMMNDALECYFVFQEAKMIGEYLPEESVMQASIAKRDNMYALIVRQREDSVFTLWFQGIRKELHCYQYHEIGHFWVDGQEQWRQLVYMIGTIYEKYEYLGESVCNPIELELLPLVEFGPFRRWTPIHESLDGWYPKTHEGINCMEHFALMASDYLYARVIRMYRRFPNPILEELLGKMLLYPNHEKLYQTIYNKVVEASKIYPKRQYSYEVEQIIRKQRQGVDRELRQNGYEGEYPVYRFNDIYVMATEEHPFTLMEAKNFHFKIHLMISQCMDKEPEHNSGFFRSKKRQGWVWKIFDEEFNA